MRRSASTPWIIALSMRLYQCLLRLGPAAYRHEYVEPTLQVFRQCCRDAYKQRGTPGVLAFWLPMFSEALSGMLAEHFSALRRVYERIGQMLPTMRRSMIVTIGSFVFFGVAYLCLMRITDPREPLDAAANAHLSIRLAFATINWSAQIAFLLVVLGGLPFLFIAIKQAIARKRGNLRALFTIRPKPLLILIACTIILEVGFFGLLIIAQVIAGAPSKPQAPIVPLPPLEIAAQIGIITLFTFVLVTITALASQAILRSDFSMRMLHYALILMGLTTLAMGTSLVATVIWIISMWINAPQIADSLGLGPAGLRGEIGGSEGVLIVVAMMVLAAAVTALALRRGLRARTMTLA